MPEKKPEQKSIKVNAHQTSSAATKYGGVDQDWLKKIKGSFEWFKLPQFDIKKVADDMQKLITKGLQGGIIKEVGQAIIGNLKERFGSITKGISDRMGSIVTVGKKSWGQLTNTAEGKGLAIFGAIATTLIGGGVLLGAGPEMVTGMLRMTQLAYTLNLNESDEQIEKQIEGGITNLYAISGQALGSGLASFVSGGVFRIPRVQINMSRVAILWRGLNEEARSQLMIQLKSLARTAFFSGIKMFVKVFYRDARKWLKDLAKSDPNHPLIKMIPGGAKSLEHWGAKGAAPWSLSLYKQKYNESLQGNKKTRDIGIFMENFDEGFGESIQEFLPDLVRQPIS